MESKGVPVPAGTYLFRTPARVAALDADIQDAINDGVIVVSSAGNSYWNMVTSTSDDWNNIVSGINHNRGSSPGAADNVICVGNVGVSNNQYKANSSNYGERVDIWAPGTNIVSAVYDSTAASEFGVTLANDPRDSNYKLASISGTSMSGPQIAGLLACYAEQNQNLSQAEALEYLIDNSTQKSEQYNILPLIQKRLKSSKLFPKLSTNEAKFGIQRFKGGFRIKFGILNFLN